MIQLIIGEKGNGKTKVLLEKVNTDIKTAAGTVDYIDKSKQHMYELNNKIRLIDLTDFPVTNTDSFIGFLCGIISQDHDLEEIYLDSFLAISALEDNRDEIEKAIKEVDTLGEKYGIKFILSVSLDSDELPEAVREFVTISL